MDSSCTLSRAIVVAAPTVRSAMPMEVCEAAVHIPFAKKAQQIPRTAMNWGNHFLRHFAPLGSCASDAPNLEGHTSNTVSRVRELPLTLFPVPRAAG